MEIAIVDDLSVERKEVRRLLLEYFTVHNEIYGITPIISEFESGETFLNTFQQGKYQLVLLDIYMKQLSGIDVAEKLCCLDKKCNIIFFTTSKDHMLDGYDVHAVGYVLKPVAEHQTALNKALTHVMEKLNIDNSCISCLTEFGENTILYRNIVYLESSMRNLYLHFASDTILVLGKYSDYAQQLLSDKRFLECYRNLIVNMDYIDTPLENDFMLKTGEKVPISRRKKVEVMEKYTTYFIEGRCN
ncbi:LytTR family DNA-binding domain-containing protein [Paludicola sp. MB14-C6]|uniref:LytR/AlgR family response regulator transcription factor n=1 Tax=Paludihabitans sp. MB14-C6 TaxID=3070656 RepID=UPI0027DD0768|nr:LytTR family DNA-binding domain-containing protein [Paludicola sp. MB14-C6]WMJ21911.1 LytTR family DNA-binding domain-containing protein [Paludicola sp. MB14-C6]